MTRVCRNMWITLLLLCICGCAAAETAPGAVLAAMPARSLNMLGSAYMQQMNTSAAGTAEEAEVRRKVAEIMAGDYAAPDHVFLVTGPAGDGDAQGWAWPYEAAERIRRTNPSPLAFLDEMRALKEFMDGTGISALVSNAADDRLYAADQPEGCGLLFLVYRRGTPYVVAWNAENGAVRLRGSFLQDASLARCDTETKLAAWLAARGYPEADVTGLKRDAQAASEASGVSGTGGFDPERARQLAERMAMQAAQDVPQERSAALAAAFSQRPRLILVGEPGQDLLSMGVLLETRREPQEVRAYVERFYERQAVEMLAKFSRDGLTKPADSAFSLSGSGPCSLIYQDASARGSGAAILLYEEAPPVCLYWYAENGAVRMEGWFGPEALGACRSAAEVAVYQLANLHAAVSIPFREWRE